MHRFALNLFRIWGIQIRLHLSFLVLPAMAFWMGYQLESWLGGFYALLLVLCAFTCVLLHELGHCWAAYRCGIRVPRITLLPIGGMAEFESIPRRPRDEIFIALAGPAVNVLIAGVLLLFVRLPADLFTSDETPFADLSRLGLDLLITNIFMAAFNLIPAFPMDGGRVFRAILALRFPYLKATFLAALTAKILATLCIALALWQGLWLLAVLFAFIIFVGEAEYRAIRRAEENARFWQRVQEAEQIPNPPPEPPDHPEA